MKIEIEVTEQDIKEAVERRIKNTVCEEWSATLATN